MTARRATFGCCGAPAVPPFQHKCKGGDAPVGCTTKDRAQAAEPVRAPLSRPGQLAEDALVAALRADGQEVVTFPEWMRRAFDGHYLGWVTQFPVGIMLAPARRYRADLFLPSRRLVLEVEGGCHGIQRQRRGDILREQLLAAAGLRVVRVLPEQAIDGSAVELVSRAIGAKECK